MRCISCGYVNAPQAFECGRCRKILDPIAAAATVSLPTETAPAPPASTGYQSNYSSNGSAPPPPPLPDFPGFVRPTNSAPPPPPSVGVVPPRRMLVSADEDYLAESAAAGRFLNPNVNQNYNVRVDTCQRCGKKVELALGEFICRDCVAERSTEQKQANKRDKLLRVFGALVAGIVAVAVCGLLAGSFGAVRGQVRDLNWELTLAVGLVVGLAVRLGARNKPSVILQLMGLLLGLVAIFLAIYMALGTYGTVPLSVDGIMNAIKTTSPTIVDYLYPVGGLLIAFTVPSGLFGGNSND